MDKISNNAPLWLVIALSLKGIILGVSGADAAIAVSLIGLLVLKEYLAKHKILKELENETKEKLKAMSEAINLQNEVIKAQAIEFDKLRGSITGLKLQNGVKETFSQLNPLKKQAGL